MSVLMTDQWSAIIIVAEKGLVMRLWSATPKNVWRGNQKVDSNNMLPSSLVLNTVKLNVFIRWKTGGWTDCSKTCNDGHPGERTREVICVDESHDIETEDQESYCAGPKPVTRETCALQACPAEWVTVKSGLVSMKKG